MSRLVFALALGWFLMGSTPTVSPVPPGDGTRSVMQRFGENMSILLQNIGALDEHPSKDARNKVIQSLGAMKSLAHTIQPSMGQDAIDPIMRYISLDLSRQFSRIEEAYLQSNYAGAHALLRQTTQYCVGCHAASSNKGSAIPLFRDPSFQPVGMAKAEYLSATRQHEAAMLAYEEVLADPKVKIAQPEVWERAFTNLLALTIRIRNEAPITLEMISARLDEGHFFPEQMERLRVWRASARTWMSEPRRPPRSAAEMVQKAQELMEKGQLLSQQGNNFGLIEYLRAATLLNSVAMGQPDDELKANSYQLMAQINENLRGVYVWMRPEAYYEACIRIRPHSAVSRNCADRLGAWQKIQGEPILGPDILHELSALAQ